MTNLNLTDKQVTLILSGLTALSAQKYQFANDMERAYGFNDGRARDARMEAHDVWEQIQVLRAAVVTAMKG